MIRPKRINMSTHLPLFSGKKITPYVFWTVIGPRSLEKPVKHTTIMLQVKFNPKKHRYHGICQNHK